MSDFHKIIQEIIMNLDSIVYKGDISDIGNEIGVVLGKHFNDEDIQSFIHGIKHGVSLSNGTH